MVKVVSRQERIFGFGIKKETRVEMIAHTMMDERRTKKKKTCHDGYAYFPSASRMVDGQRDTKQAERCRIEGTIRVQESIRV